MNFFFQTGLISTTSSVVFIIARIASIFITLTAVPIYDFHMSFLWKLEGKSLGYSGAPHQSFWITDIHNNSVHFYVSIFTLCDLQNVFTVVTALHECIWISGFTASFQSLLSTSCSKTDYSQLCMASRKVGAVVTNESFLTLHVLLLFPGYKVGSESNVMSMLSHVGQSICLECLGRFQTCKNFKRSCMMHVPFVLIGIHA